MQNPINALIDQYEREFFVPALAKPNKEGDLNLAVEGLIGFLTLQICLPIITGLLTSWLYDRWKMIQVKSEADQAIKEIQSYLAGSLSAEVTPPEKKSEIERHVRSLLVENGFSEHEASQLTARLIARIEADLRQVKQSA